MIAMSKDNNVHANHRQRMKKRYKDHGADNFHDHELLEMMLYYCYPRCDTNPIAHKMLKEFGSLQNLFDASPETLAKRLNCSENIAVFVSLIPAIAKRYLGSKWGAKEILNSHELAGEYAISLFIGQQVEAFYVLCLDKKFRLIKCTKIASGTIDEVPIFIRELVHHVLQHNAAHVIFAHNHPGGTINPSLDDNVVTTRARESLTLINVPVTDHIIVAGDKYFSYAHRSPNHVDGF